MFSRPTPQSPRGSSNAVPYPPPIYAYPGFHDDIDDFCRRVQAAYMQSTIVLLSREEEEELFGKEPQPEESESVTVLHLSKYSKDVATNTHIGPFASMFYSPQVGPQTPRPYRVMNSTRSKYRKGNEAKKADKNSNNIEIYNPCIIKVKLFDPSINREEEARAWVPGSVMYESGLNAVETPEIRMPDIETFALSQGVTELYQWSPTADINMHHVG